MNRNHSKIRKYDNTTGRFITPDALWEKYYAWSPYHYSANNPVNMSDGNGYLINIEYMSKDQKIETYTYNYGSDYSNANLPPYVEEVITSIEYLSKDIHGRDIGLTNKVFNIFSKSKDKHLTIKFPYNAGENDSKQYYDGNGNVIYEPMYGFLIINRGSKKNEIQSPALGLWHEASHAYLELFEGVSYEKQQLFEDQYDSQGDKIVIEKYENPVARKLGEPNRYHHRGRLIPVESPISRKRMR